jgi:site-specific recombinase XerD
LRSKQLSSVRASGPGVTLNPAERQIATPHRRAPNAAGRLSGYSRACPAMEKILRRFESYLHQHALSPTTIRNYLADLRAFSRWHIARRHEATPPADGAGFEPADFRAYRDYLCRETNHSTATVNRRLQSLRLFGRFLQELGHLAENPTREIELVRNGNGHGGEPRTLTPSEIARLTDAIRSGRPSLATRDQAIMQLMLQAGLRVHEVAALRLRDLISTRRGTSIEVRNNRHTAPRRVPLNRVASRALRAYVGKRPVIPRVDHLFVSQRGQPLSMRSIQRVIDTYARAAGLQGVCAQSLRHTCVKAMLAETRDMVRVAERLGQRSTRGLNRYLPRGSTP